MQLQQVSAPGDAELVIADEAQGGAPVWIGNRWSIATVLDLPRCRL